MQRSIKLKRGLDIRIEGVAEKVISGLAEPLKYGVKPIDFPGLVPKLNVKPGDIVQGGTALFHDKKRPEIVFSSPVSGTVLSIERGDRRKLLEVVIEKSGEDYYNFGKSDPSDLSAEEIKSRLLGSGLWPSIRQRPYNIIARPDSKPKSVFVSGFDTAPLAPDYNYIAMNIPVNLMQTGIKVISRLAGRKVNLVLNGNIKNPEILTGLSDVEISYFSGPHPAGNPGVHIHHLDPVNKGEVVWIINFQDLISIGRLFAEGIYRPEKIVALTGSEVLKPQYYRVLSGASVEPLVKNNVKEGNLRYISGNVLTGTKICAGGFLGYYDSQVTVIPEGDYYEFFGWALPGIDKFSFSRTYISRIFPRNSYRLDTNLHGGERAFVMTGEYEKVVPMDIYPVQLLKAILAGDIDRMENLGIYEIAEEDLALCEYICASKIEVQSIVRNGLDLMIKEMN